jgi:hypothetical protein
MKIPVLQRLGVSHEMVGLVSRLVEQVPWPARRLAMADVATTLLAGKPRITEDVFGWSRGAVELGLHELRAGIACVNDLSTRRKPKAEEKHPQMLADIRAIMDPESQADPHLRTTLSYTNMTAVAVREALLAKGWPDDVLPGQRTISNILNRSGYRLRTVVKTMVQRERRGPTPSSRKCTS